MSHDAGFAECVSLVWVMLKQGIECSESRCKDNGPSYGFKNIVRSGAELSKSLLIAGVVAACLMSAPSLAEDIQTQREYRAGFALAMPSIGISLQSVLSEQHTVSAVLGNGLQVQANFTGESSEGSYYLLGAGRDDTIGLIRFGYGYVWEFARLSFHVEASLNLPVWDRELGGLADVGKVVYLFPIGAGVHYRF
jgi:hypothetical protein